MKSPLVIAQIIDGSIRVQVLGAEIEATLKPALASLTARICRSCLAGRLVAREDALLASVYLGMDGGECLVEAISAAAESVRKTKHQTH